MLCELDCGVILIERPTNIKIKTNNSIIHPIIDSCHVTNKNHKFPFDILHTKRGVGLKILANLIMFTCYSHPIVLYL